MEDNSSQWPHGGGQEAPNEPGLIQTTRVSCPYCGEAGELIVDPAGGSAQEYVEDCEVCCRPWSIRLTFDVQGRPTAIIGTLEDT